MDDVILVLCNVPNADNGQALARKLVEAGLAACVNLMPGVQSIYRWQGKVEQAQEITLLIKSSAGRYDELEAAIRGLHPYELPEILCLPVPGGLPAYLQWVMEETRKPLEA